MKIKISLTIEVDPQEWAAVYGTGTAAAEVREDVKTYVQNQVWESPGIQESGGKVTIR